jgi:SAM-dependent methyltransferase
MNEIQSGSIKVAEYYESVENKLWDIVSEGHIHLGLWDETNSEASFSDGTMKLTQVMIDMTNIDKDQNFCDIGCGIGLPAIVLAKKRGCHVDGITISAYQKNEAEERAIKAGIAELTSFWVADALHMPFENCSYDGGWFFESIFHMGHRPALQEAKRVLKPGAELLIADVVDIGSMTEEDKKLAKDLCNAEYIPASFYPELLEETGYQLMDQRDITKDVMELFPTKFVEAVKNKKKDLLKIVDENILNAFEKIAEQIARTAGYIIVKARRI